MTNQTIDMMIRIKNGYLVGKKYVIASHSKLNSEVLLILKNNNYIDDYKIDTDPKIKHKHFLIELKYQDNKSAITDIEIVSKPGKRIYLKSKYIKHVLGGLGLLIISTPNGLMTDSKAIKTHQGGEVLFSIW